MRRSLHALRLLRELVGFSIINRIWWPLPLVVLLVLAGLLMLAAQAAAPFTVYTLF